MAKVKYFIFEANKYVMIVSDVINYLEEVAPISYAEDFDNVGLLVGIKNNEVTGILVTLDTLESVVDAAIEKKCNLIFSFHPIIFNGLKKVNGNNYVERVVIKAIQNNIERIITSHRAFDNRIKNHPKVKTTRQTGIIYALDLNLEMERYGNARDKLFQFFMEHGVFLRPLGNTIYIQAPYVITEEQLEKVYQTIEKALDMF